MKFKRIFSTFLGTALIASLSLSVSAADQEVKIINGPNGERYECVEVSPNSRTMVPKLDVEVSMGDKLEEVPANIALYKVLNPGARSNDGSEIYVASIEQPVVFTDYFQHRDDIETGLDGATIYGEMFYEVNAILGNVRYISANIDYRDGGNGTVLLDKTYHAYNSYHNLVCEDIRVPDSYSSYGNTYNTYVKNSSIYLHGTAVAYNGSYRDNLSISVSSVF